jgi:hypothetical protein
MLKLDKLSHNNHFSEMKMLINFIRRGIRVLITSAIEQDGYEPELWNAAEGC